MVGVRMIESGAHKKVIVVGADKMSSITDYTDRANCILFGDAGGAVLLEPSVNPEMGVLDSILRSDGSGAPYLYMAGGGSLNPPTHATVDKKMHYLYQDGATVFKFAVKGMADVSEEILIRNGLSGKDVDLFVAHQANLRIIDASAKRMGLQKEQVMINIDKYGNTTAATIPICLSEAVEQKRLKKGDLVVLASFGAGFTWGSILVRWVF
jgi:3-oxoacyl-[acyl-carrier-protein] synthase-3